jgi:hypothetical protein
MSECHLPRPSVYAQGTLSADREGGRYRPRGAQGQYQRTASNGGPVRRRERPTSSIAPTVARHTAARTYVAATSSTNRRMVAAASWARVSHASTAMVPRSVSCLSVIPCRPYAGGRARAIRLRSTHKECCPRIQRVPYPSAITCHAPRRSRPMPSGVRGALSAEIRIVDPACGSGSSRSAMAGASLTAATDPGRSR